MEALTARFNAIAQNPLAPSSRYSALVNEAQTFSYEEILHLMHLFRTNFLSSELVKDLYAMAESRFGALRLWNDFGRQRAEVCCQLVGRSYDEGVLKGDPYYLFTTPESLAWLTEHSDIQAVHYAPSSLNFQRFCTVLPHFTHLMRVKLLMGGWVEACLHNEQNRVALQEALSRCPKLTNFQLCRPKQMEIPEEYLLSIATEMHNRGVKIWIDQPEFSPEVREQLRQHPYIWVTEPPPVTQRMDYPTVLWGSFSNASKAL